MSKSSCGITLPNGLRVESNYILDSLPKKVFETISTIYDKIQSISTEAYNFEARFLNSSQGIQLHWFKESKSLRILIDNWHYDQVNYLYSDISKNKEESGELRTEEKLRELWALFCN